MKIVIASDGCAHDDVRVTVHVFGQRVHDDVGAQFEWSLQIRCQECVVDNDNNLIKLFQELKINSAIFINNLHWDICALSLQ